jgi:hypothetical protein
MTDADKKNAMLLEELQSGERELTRRSIKSMELLLHADFVEFGRSGTRYSRNDVLIKFADKGLPAVNFCNFELAVLAEDVALLTYLSADADGNPQTLRSSIWVHTEVGWQIRFHQGTAVRKSDY